MSLVLALLGALRAALRTRTDLTLENLALRQQLALLRRRSRRPQFGRLDRLLWVRLSQRWAGWRGALHIIRPETVIRWHRLGLRAFWSWRSQRKRLGRPSVGRSLPNSSAPWRSQILSGVRRASMANCSSWGSRFRSGPSHVSCRAGRSHPRRPGALSSRTTSPILPPWTSSSCRLRHSGCSMSSWFSCTIGAESSTSTSPKPRRQLGPRSRS